MAIQLRSGTSSNLGVVESDGAVRTATRAYAFTPTTVTVPAATTGVYGPVDVTTAGNVTFIIKNAAPATPWTGTPTVVFEQSDDSLSWTPLVAVRSDTGEPFSTHTLAAGAANTSIMFNAALQGATAVRVRVTAGTTTGALTLVAQPGGLAFTPAVAVAAPARTNVALYGTALPVGTTGTETLLTLTQQKGVAAAVNANSYLVPAGRRLRLQTLAFTMVGNATAAAATCIFRLRYNPAGPVTATSTPILLPARTAAPSTASSFTSLVMPLPADGYEIAGDGTAQFGVTVTPTFTTNAPTVDVLLLGYEY